MSDYWRRLAVPAIVFITALVVLETMQLLLAPVRHRVRYAAVTSMVPLSGASIYHNADGYGGSVLESWTVRDTDGAVAGIVARVRQTGYAAPIEVLVAVSLDGTMWGLRIISAYEYHVGQDALIKERPGIDAVAGATVTNQAIRRSISDAREEAARQAAAERS